MNKKGFSLVAVLLLLAVVPTIQIARRHPDYPIEPDGGGLSFPIIVPNDGYTLNQAVSLVNANGWGSIEITQDCYITSELWISVSNVKIFGMGQSTHIYCSGCRCFRIDNGIGPGTGTIHISDVDISDLWIVGQNNNTNEGIYMYYAERIRLENLQISGMGIGIYGFVVHNLWTTNCQVRNSGMFFYGSCPQSSTPYYSNGMGIKLIGNGLGDPTDWNNSTVDAFLSNIQCTVCASDGFYFGRSEGIKATACTSLNNGGDGYDLEGCQWSTFVDCGADGNTGTGFYLKTDYTRGDTFTACWSSTNLYGWDIEGTDTTNLYEIHINGGTTRNNNDYGVYMWDCQHCVVGDGITVTDNSQSSSGTYFGIYLGRCYHCSITNCISASQWQNCQGTGIDLSVNSNNNLVHGNTATITDYGQGNSLADNMNP